MPPQKKPVQRWQLGTRKSVQQAFPKYAKFAEIANRLEGLAKEKSGENSFGAAFNRGLLEKPQTFGLPLIGRANRLADQLDRGEKNAKPLPKQKQVISGALKILREFQKRLEEQFFQIEADRQWLFENARVFKWKETDIRKLEDTAFRILMEIRNQIADAKQQEKKLKNALKRLRA